MSKKPIKYTHEDKESGMVSEPSAAVAYNVGVQHHMDVVQNGTNALHTVSEQDDDRNDEAWTEWAKQWTPEFQARVDSYDGNDPLDPNQTWYTQEEMDARIYKLVKDHANRI